ncbi:MAG: ceramide glucosyltransferase [Paracoccaceae bacterium]
MASVLVWFVVFAMAAQLIGSVLALSTMTRRKSSAARTDCPAISVLRPVCGIENNLEETLTTTFQADYPEFEILFCVALPNDPAIPLVNRLMAAYPAVPAQLLIGDDRISGNPKLNNLVKGWRAARHSMILMADSNVLLPPDYLHRLMDQWEPGTGLVSSPPIGIRPDGFWARLECAFLNTFQARWQLASVRMGNGFAQGKMLFWQRDLLEKAGGLAVLGTEMAEDVASTKVVRTAGLHVSLPNRFFAQPIGRRSFDAVWSRQLRWSRVRRLGFLMYFLPELLAGAALPFVALVILVASGVTLWAIPAFLVLWYGMEYVVAAKGDWPRAGADVAAWGLRDLILPVLWLASWAGSSFEWRGNVMSAGDVAEAPDAPPALNQTPNHGA